VAFGQNQTAANVAYAISYDYNQATQSDNPITISANLPTPCDVASESCMLITTTLLTPDPAPIQ
jgi:hypothetical protein